MHTKTVMALVAESKGRIQNLTPDEVARELENGEVVLVDLREPAELAEQGVIAGAIHAPRGMLEFYADPASAYHREEFQPGARSILYCASGGRRAGVRHPPRPRLREPRAPRRRPEGLEAGRQAHPAAALTRRVVELGLLEVDADRVTPGSLLPWRTAPEGRSSRRHR